MEYLDVLSLLDLPFYSYYPKDALRIYQSTYVCTHQYVSSVQFTVQSLMHNVHIILLLLPKIKHLCIPSNTSVDRSSLSKSITDLLTNIILIT